MAPTKTRSLENCCDGRLVDVILNIKQIIGEMKDKIDRTYDIINQQQHEISIQRQINAEIINVLKNKSTDLKIQESDVFKTPAQFSHLLTTHNDSGPEGLTCVYNDTPGDKQVQNEVSASTTLPSPKQSTPTHTPVPIQTRRLRSRPRRKLQSEAVQEQPSTSPVIESAAPAARKEPVSKAAAPPVRLAPARAVQAESVSQVRSTKSTTSAPEAVVKAAITAAPTTSAVPAAKPVPSTPAAPGPPDVSDPPRKLEGLRAATQRPVSLHVFNLSTETTTDDVIRHVKSIIGIQVDICERLKVTRGQYSSFRIDVPASKVRLVRNSKHWPDGVSVRMFNVVEPKNFQVDGGARPPH